MLKQIFALTSLILIFGGCSAKKIDLGLPQAEVSPERRAVILNDYFHDRDEVKAFRGLAVARNKIKDDLFKVRYIFLASTDGRLRIDSLPVNSGIVMTVLKSDGQRAVLLDNAPKIAYVTSADDNLLDRALNVPLAPSRLPFLLAARIPKSQIVAQRSAIYENDDEIILLDKAQNEVYRFNGLSRTLLRLTKLNEKNTEIIWELSWAYDGDSKESQPSLMTLRLPSKDYSGSFSWRVFEINPEISTELFKAVIPGGWKRKNL